jgi:acyl carrier protein
VSDAETVADRAPILATVATLVQEVIGDEFLLDTVVTMETTFTEDLELESIEFVALSERIQIHYGERVDFVAWLSGMEVDEIIGLTVGELVDFIASCHS